MIMQGNKCVLFIFLNLTILGFVSLKIVIVPLESVVHNVSVKRNEHLELDCNVQSPDFSCRWIKDGVPFHHENIYEDAVNNCTLVLYSSVVEVDKHDGQWNCTILNGTDIVASKEVYITVLSQPIGPVIMVDGKERKTGSYVPVSSSSSIMCRVVYGNPAANLSWQVDGVEVAGHAEIIEYESTKEKSTDLYLTQHFDPSWYGKTLKCISRHPTYLMEKVETYIYFQHNISDKSNWFLKEPDDVEVNEGDSASFECITQKPFAICLWEKDGWTVIDSLNYKYIINDNRCAIEIKQANNYVRDELWRCSVGNETAVAMSKEAKLTVLVKPMGPLLSVDGLAQLNGSEVQVDIHRHPRIQCISGSGKPAAYLAMSLDDRPLKVTHEISKRGFILASKIMTESTLIEPVDSTWYNKTLFCHATHPSYENNTRMTYVTIRENDRIGGTLFVREPHDVLVTEDQRNVTLECVAAEPIDSCYWELDGDRIASSPLFEYNKTNRNCSATMPRINFYMNDGYYKCVVTKDLVPTESKMAKISVVVEPNGPYIKLRSRQLKNDSDVVLQSGRVDVSCESSFGYPAATLEWFLDDVPVEGNYEIHKYFWSKKATAYLTLTASVDETWHGKTLKCIAKHQLFDSNQEKVTFIKVRSPITTVKACFANGLLTFNVTESTDSPVMYCLSHDDPLVRFRWERRSNQNDTWKQFSDLQNATAEGTFGEFSCVVTNKFEAIRSKSILSVYAAPHSTEIVSNFENSGANIKADHFDTVKLNCVSEAFPAAKFRWEHRSINSYDVWRNFSFSQSIAFEGVVGQFACVAYNRLGFARSEVVTVTIPHAVSVVKAFSNDQMLDITTGRDENVTLYCLADGSPPPSYNWESRRTASEPWSTVANTQNITVHGSEGQYSCVAWNMYSDSKQRSPEILTVTFKRASYVYAGLIGAVTALIGILLIIVLIVVIYYRRLNRPFNVLVDCIQGPCRSSTEIPSERIQMNDDDGDEEGIIFETSSLAPLN